MTPEQYVLRQAQAQDLDVVMALLRERVEWLRSRGSDQWSSWTNWSATKIQPSLDEGHVWLLLAGEDPIGTITVEFRGDIDFWTPQECVEPAAYLSKLAIRLDHAGNELGALLTDWASDYAYRRGCKFVRLDAWKTNDQLHAYYADRGWKHVRTVDNPGRNSGSLFQLPVCPLPFAQRARLREDLPVTVLEQARVGSLTAETDVAGNWRPHHVHKGGVTCAYETLQRPIDVVFIDLMCYRLRHESKGWKLDAVDRHFTDWRNQGMVLDASVPLEEGTTYVITHQELVGTCRMIMTAIPDDLGQACVPPRGRAEAKCS